MSFPVRGCFGTEILKGGLRQRGRYGKRESGAFLLGHRRDGCARITQFVLYDDLDPKCLETGIIRFDGRYFGALWELCNQHDLLVVADVHTHPAGSQQSDSDRYHPMISRAGHIALIVTRFAAAPVMRDQVGVYLYEGAQSAGISIPAQCRRAFSSYWNLRRLPIMTEFSRADTLHRLVKEAVDSGAASSLAEADAMFRGFRLGFVIADSESNDPAHQAALLTGVALARRVFLGGVSVSGALSAPLTIPFPMCATIGEAVVNLGGSIDDHVSQQTLL